MSNGILKKDEKMLRELFNKMELAIANMNIHEVCVTPKNHSDYWWTRDVVDELLCNSLVLTEAIKRYDEKIKSLVDRIKEDT